jgi:hypothetical protein
VHGADHAAVVVAHDRTRLALGGVCSQFEQLFSPIGNVDVRIFLVGDEQCRLHHHGFREMAVRIEQASDHGLQSGNFPAARDQVSLAIVIAVRDHGAVQRKEHHVDGQ